MRTVIVGVFLSCLVAVCSAAGPFDGRWSVQLTGPAPQAVVQNLTITLKTDDAARVTGSVAIQGGAETPIEWGMIKGDVITFKVKLPFQNGTTTFVHLGKLEGDQIAFGRRPEDLTLGRLREFTALRAK